MKMDFFKKSLVPYIDEYRVTKIGIDHIYTSELGDIITEEKCIELFEKDIVYLNNLLLPILLNENQTIALTSLYLNIGKVTFERSYLYYCLRNNKFNLVPDQFNTYTKVGGVLNQSLIQRRMKEKILYETIV